MGIFNRRGNRNVDKLDQISETLKELTNNDRSLSALFFYKSRGGGSSFLQGDAHDIHKMLAATAKQDSSFASIIKMVARDISADGLDPRMPQELKDILTGKKTGGVVDLPGGSKGIAIDPDNIENLSDKDVDDIIDGIINTMPKDPDDDK